MHIHIKRFKSPTMDIIILLICVAHNLAYLTRMSLREIPYSTNFKIPEALSWCRKKLKWQNICWVRSLKICHTFNSNSRLFTDFPSGGPGVTFIFQRVSFVDVCYHKIVSDSLCISNVDRPSLASPENDKTDRTFHGTADCKLCSRVNCDFTSYRDLGHFIIGSKWEVTFAFEYCGQRCS